MGKKQKGSPVVKDLRKPHFKSFYYVLIALFLLLFFATLLLSGGTKLTAALFGDRVDTFMDHYNSVIYNEVKDPYEILVVYPPLASLLYKLCNIAIPADDYYSYVTDPSVLSQDRGLKVSQSFTFQFILYAIVAVLIFLAALCLLKKGSNAEKALFAAATLLSSPFLYMADRGNNVILPVAFSMIFVVLYNHENKVLRELGLISLAVAVGLKIYPLAFLLFFIADRRYKDLLREILYICVLLVLPFFIFYNGFSSMKLMLKNLFGFDAKRTTESNLAGQLDFKRMFFYTYGFTQRFTGIVISDRMREVYANICRYGMSAVCALGTIFTDKMWKRTMLIAAVIYGFPGSASTYILLFMVIPTALFLDEEKTPSFKNYLYLFLIVMTQVPIIVRSGDGYSRHAPTKISSAAVGLIVLIAFIELIAGFAAWNEARRKNGQKFFRSAGGALKAKFVNVKSAAAADASGAAAIGETAEPAAETTAETAETVIEPAAEPAFAAAETAAVQAETPESCAEGGEAE